MAICYSPPAASLIRSRGELETLFIQDPRFMHQPVIFDSAERQTPEGQWALGGTGFHGTQIWNDPKIEFLHAPPLSPHP